MLKLNPSENYLQVGPFEFVNAKYLRKVEQQAKKGQAK